MNKVLPFSDVVARLGVLLLVGFLFVLNQKSVAQDNASGNASLSRVETQVLGALVERFRPMSVVEQIWIGAFEAAGKTSRRLTLAVDSLERSEMPESELFIQVGALRQEMRLAREERNAFVAEFLSPSDRLALDSIFSPPKPSIQHFGFHDRMQCLVCKEPGAVKLGLKDAPVPTLKQQ